MLSHFVADAFKIPLETLRCSDLKTRDLTFVSFDLGFGNGNCTLQLIEYVKRHREKIKG